MATRTFSRDSLKIDRETFDLSKLDGKFGLDFDRWSEIDVSRRVSEWNKSMSERLDRIEERLPSPANQMFHLQREFAGTGYSMTRSATESLVGATSNVYEQAKTSAERVVKTMRRESDDVRSDVTRMASATKATATDVVDDVATSVAETADSTADRVESLRDEAEDYKAWTREDLYNRAQDLDIAGRSSMSKNELIAAIRKHQ